MDIAITKMSSKGQVVIPTELRGNIKVGEKLLIIKGDDKIIMKKANKLDSQFEEDLEFARRTEQAWKRIEKGQGIKMEFDEFIKDMKKW